MIEAGEGADRRGGLDRRARQLAAVTFVGHVLARGGGESWLYTADRPRADRK